MNRSYRSDMIYTDTGGGKPRPYGGNVTTVGAPLAVARAGCGASFVGAGLAPARACMMILIILSSICTTFAFRIPPEHKPIADKVVREILECRFDNAMRLSNDAFAADPNNAMAAVLHLVSAGMRDVDADYTIDSDAFMKSFERAKAAVEKYETANGVSSYSLTLKGFTLGIHASFHLKNGSYFAAAGTGMDAIKLMREAKELDPKNTEVNFFLGLYEFALADLKKKLWMIMFWHGGSKQNGIKQLEQGAKLATLTGTAAALALSDVYVKEKQPEKSKLIIDRLKKEIPESRFLLWSEVKFYEEQKIYKQAGDIYGKLADSYERAKYGSYNAVATRNKQAHMYNLAGEKQAAIEACEKAIKRGSGSGSDKNKKIQAVVKDTEKLLGKLKK